MIVSTIKKLLILTLSAAIFAPRLHSMQLSQLNKNSNQLQQIKNNTSTIEADLYILPGPAIIEFNLISLPQLVHPISYTMINATNIKKFTLNTPSVNTLITKKKTNRLIQIKNEWIFPIPLNALLSCDTNSEIFIKTINQNLKLTCCSYSPEETFKTELEDHLKNFFQNPYFILTGKNDTEKIEEIKIFRKNKIITEHEPITNHDFNYDFFIMHKGIISVKGKASFPKLKHGKNGHTDIKQLTNQLITQEVAHRNNDLTPNKNIFYNIMKRELGGKLTKISSLPAPEVLQAPERFPTPQLQNQDQK